MKQKDYFYDLHCHTSEGSADAPASLEDVIKMAKKRGLDGVAITNHNNVYKGPLNIDGIDIIPGVEITTKEKEHILGFFIQKERGRRKTFKGTISDIHKEGGYAVWAHPIRKGEFFKNEKEKVLLFLDGVEAGNALESKEDISEVSDIAKKMKIPETAGSDVHVDGQVGLAVLKVPERITKENFLSVIKKGEVIVRDESMRFKRTHNRWKGLLNKVKNIIALTRISFLKMIFYKLILKNYLKLQNLKIRKLEFNYKEDGGKSKT